MQNCNLDKANALDRIAKAWSMSIEELAHTLATKLATLQLKQQGLHKVIPSLIAGYHLAVEHHLIEDKIGTKLLNQLDDMQNLDQQIIPMFELLENLNNYSSQVARHDATEIPSRSAQQFLADLLKNYIYEKDSQRNLIELNPNQDFEIKYPLLFIESSLRHILTAALQRLTMSGKGQVKIWISDETDSKIFNIKDAGLRASDDQVADPFNHLIFEPYDNARPGLGFCRLAMLQIGGDITCAISDDSTHFKIIFPKSD